MVTSEHHGHPAGMTLNSFTSVSLDPLLVLVSLAHGSRTLEKASQKTPGFVEGAQVAIESPTFVTPSALLTR